ncbi:MAG: hypothetical protein WCI93_02995 [bacterium]
MKNKSTKIFLPPLVLVFLVFCSLFIFLYIQTKGNIKIAEQTEADFQKEVSHREEIKDFNNSFKSIEEERALLETHFAQSSDIVPFLNKIENMASSVNTKVEVSFIEVAKDNTGLVLEMRDTGNFEQVYKFLTLLENSPYELEITLVEMNKISIEEKNNINKKVWEALYKIKLISFI